MRRRSVAVLMTVALLAAAGCGEQRDGERAAETVDALVRALEEGRGPEACRRLSERGVSELLLAAVRDGTRVDPSPREEPCAAVAERLAERATGLRELREAPVTRILVDGDRATVETERGAYEVEELEGRWRVSRLEPLAQALSGERPPERPVHLRVVRPKLEEPALGPAVAGRLDDTSTELGGTIAPDDARLRVETSPGVTAERVEAGDGRFRVKLRLRPGEHEVVLVGEAPGHETTTRVVRLTAPAG